MVLNQEIYIVWINFVLKQKHLGKCYEISFEN